MIEHPVPIGTIYSGHASNYQETLASILRTSVSQPFSPRELKVKTNRIWGEPSIISFLICKTTIKYCRTFILHIAQTLVRLKLLILITLK